MLLEDQEGPAQVVKVAIQFHKFCERVGIYGDPHHQRFHLKPSLKISSETLANSQIRYALRADNFPTDKEGNPEFLKHE